MLRYSSVYHFLLSTFCLVRDFPLLLWHCLRWHFSLKLKTLSAASLFPESYLVCCFSWIFDCMWFIQWPRSVHTHTPIPRSVHKFCNDATFYTMHSRLLIAVSGKLVEAKHKFQVITSKRVRQPKKNMRDKWNSWRDMNKTNINRRKLLVPTHTPQFSSTAYDHINRYNAVHCILHHWNERIWMDTCCFEPKWSGVVECVRVSLGNTSTRHAQKVVHTSNLSQAQRPRRLNKSEQKRTCSSAVARVFRHCYSLVCARSTTGLRSVSYGYSVYPTMMYFKSYFLPFDTMLELDALSWQNRRQAEWKSKGSDVESFYSVSNRNE